MLTRKDYKQLAEILKSVKEEHQGMASDQEELRIVNSIFYDLESNLASWLKNDNPKFNATKFQEACQK